MSEHNVLLIGGGGREHAIAWKLQQSDYLGKLFIAPGNPGTAQIGTNSDLHISDFEKVADFSIENKIDLVVVGPENPLVDGMADYLKDHNIPVFGPQKDAARLEGSKDFAKSFMEKYDIPTAAYKSFSSDNTEEALSYIDSRGVFPVVLKADGLAAGKGVFICDSREEAEIRLDQYRSDENLRKASGTIVVEEFMEGEEASVFVISDGFTAKVIHNAQDHKRVGDGDTGLNTGGMGAYCPAPVMNKDVSEQVEKEIIGPTITGMQMEESPYKGILYVGLMITSTGPKVVEYNCRFGDPECQVILPSLKNDLLDLMLSAEEQRLDQKEIQLDEKFRCCVVMASGGYPESYEKGKAIHGLDSVDEELLVFQAGTIQSDDALLSSGGRVLNVVGSGDTLREAIDHTYQNVEKIHFENAYYRTDIGAKGLKYYPKG